MWIKDKYNAVLAWYRRDDNFIRRVRFPGTRLPMLDVVSDFVKFFTKGRTIDRAAGVAFNFFVALFPLVLFMFTLLHYIPMPLPKQQDLNDPKQQDLSNLTFVNVPSIDNISPFVPVAVPPKEVSQVYQVLAPFKGTLIPEDTFEEAVEVVESIMEQPHEGLMSVSIFLCLIFGSSGIVAFFNGFRNVYANYVSDKKLSVKGWIIQRFFAIIMLLVIGVLLLFSVLMISAGGALIDYLTFVEFIKEDHIQFYAFQIIRWVVAIFAMGLSISMLYYFGNVRFDEHYRKERKNPRKGKKYRDFVIFSPGNIMATTMLFISTIGFKFYLSNFASYKDLYGSVGTLIVILLWIWIIAIIILAGNDLNSGIRRNADKLSASEDNTRKKQIVIDALKKTIQSHEQSIEQRNNRIGELLKEISEKQMLIHDIEEDNTDSKLVISAYSAFLEQEMKMADEENLENDSMREWIVSGGKTDWLEKWMEKKKEAKDSNLEA